MSYLTLLCCPKDRAERLDSQASQTNIGSDEPLVVQENHNGFIYENASKETVSSW
jgi:hypothetical protein